MTLSGVSLEIAGNTLEIGESHTRFLGMANTLYCRHVACEAEWDEASFLRQAAELLSAMNLRFKKALCGKDYAFTSPEGPKMTRSLMVM